MNNNDARQDENSSSTSPHENSDDVVQFLKTQPLFVDISAFDIEKILGEGAYGETLLAVANKNTKVIIKKLFFRELQDEDFIIFCKELKSLVECRNQFCLPVIGYTLSHPYTLILPYSSNGSLFRKLHSTDHPLTPDDLSFIMYGIAAGMKYIHSKGIIHKGIKSSNILLDQNNNPFISDFGLTRKLPIELELIKKPIASPRWTAPEFDLNDPSKYNNKIDVFSYGMLLYEMLTKSLPYKEPPNKYEEYEVHNAIAQGIRPILPKDTPKHLADLITECWHQSPDKRPSFDDIVLKLKQYQTFFKGTNRNLLHFKIDEADKNMSMFSDFPKFIKPEDANKKKENSPKNEAKPKPNFDNISFFQSKKFFENYKELDPKNAIEFFRNLSTFFQKTDFRPFIIDTLNFLNDLFKSKKAIISAFSESGIIDVLPTPPDPFFTYVITIFETIFNQDENLVTLAMFKYMKTALIYAPQPIFSLVANVLLNFSNSDGAWMTLDFYLDLAVLFIEKFSCKYLQLLYTVLQKHPNIHLERKDEIRKILLFCFNHKSTSICIEAYKFIHQYKDKTHSIPSKVLAKHIMDDYICPYAIAYIYEQKTIILTPELLMAMFSKEESFKCLAWLIRMDQSVAYGLFAAHYFWAKSKHISKENKLQIYELLEKVTHKVTNQEKPHPIFTDLKPDFLQNQLLKIRNEIC